LKAIAEVLGAPHRIGRMSLESTLKARGGC
jgi:hypothetical protein